MNKEVTVRKRSFLDLVDNQMDERLEVKFNDNVLSKNKKRKYVAITSQIGKDISNQSIVPFFIQNKRAIEKSFCNNEDKIGLDSNYSVPCTTIYPPSSKFQTMSKRFPYEKADRATSSSQELRKKIISPFTSLQETKKGGGFKSILNYINQNSEQLIQNLSSQVSFASPKSANKIQSQVNLTPSPQSPSQKLKEKKIQSNLKNIFSSQDKCIPTSKQKLRIFFQADMMKKNTNSQKESPPNCKSQIGQTKCCSKSEYVHPQRTSLSNTKIQNPLKQAQEQILSSESYLINQIQKWELKKISYEKQNLKIQNTIHSKLDALMEEKSNKPTYIATSFIENLKSVDEELDGLLYNSSQAKQRYQERLKAFHLKKYKCFLSDMKFHTDKLQHKAHDKSHLSQAI